MSKQYRRLGVFWGTVALTLSLAVACGGGDDDDDDVAYCETCEPAAPNPPPGTTVDAPSGNSATGGFDGSNTSTGGAFGVGGATATGGASSFDTGGSAFATGGTAFGSGGSAFTTGGSTFNSSFGGSAAFGGF